MKDYTFNLAQLLLTTNCQLNCKYCYEKLEPRVMTLDTAKRVVDFLLEQSKKNHKIPTISFFGGEPLLEFYTIIKPLFDYVDSLNTPFKYNITTNGLLITDEILNEFKRHNVHMMISCDGIKEAQECNRTNTNGESFFNEMETILKAVIQIMPDTTIRMTLTPNNINYFNDSIKFFEDIGYTNINFFPNLRESWSEEALQEWSKQINIYMENVKQNYISNNIPVLSSVVKAMIILYVMDLYQKDRNLYRGYVKCLPQYRCGIGVNGKLVVSPEGDFYTCPHCSMQKDQEVMYIGSLEDGVYQDKINNLLEMSQKPMKSSENKCEDCNLNSICLGGCTPDNYVINNDFSIVPKTYCDWYHILFESVKQLVNFFSLPENENVLFKDCFFTILMGG